ncbi:MAG: hypothetical protein AB7H93_08250 [Vicinamibacterales bacterium]
MGGPFVTVAAFCEKLLIEADNVASAIRIVDTYKLGEVPDIPPGLSGVEVVPVIELNGVIAIKSGDVTGEHRIDLVMENPLGERKKISPDGGWPILLNGGVHGANIKLKFPLGVKNYGLCWFDVLFDDALLTRMPLMLERAEKQTEPNPPS